MIFLPRGLAYSTLAWTALLMAFVTLRRSSKGIVVLAALVITVAMAVIVLASPMPR